MSLGHWSLKCSYWPCSALIGGSCPFFYKALWGSTMWHNPNFISTDAWFFGDKLSSLQSLPLKFRRQIVTEIRDTTLLLKLYIYKKLKMKIKVFVSSMWMSVNIDLRSPNWANIAASGCKRGRLEAGMREAKRCLCFARPDALTRLLQ